MSDKLTIQISLIRNHGEGITSNVEHPVEHTYETQKAALEDYTLLTKMLKKFGEISEVS